MAAKMNTFVKKADSIFNKRYKLKSKNDIYSLPQVDTMFSTPAFAIEPLMAIKNHLNETKNLLNSKDIEKWRRHTGKTNPCGLVVKHLREAVNPELCTQAWVKFYEIVSTCEIIPSKCIESKKLTTLHLCEAPGAFIASLNHYIKSNFDYIHWKWLASTLNPFYEGNDTKRMISGERFIIETLGHWNFGQSYDGDLMQWVNLECLLQAVGGSGKVDIVTADGSISCADDPEKQELVIGQLLYCEVVASLVHLASGGSLVVKMFTMLEHYTVGIIFLLCCFFEEVEIIKPGTSKPGNSEVYCVCTGFTGAEHLSKDLLKKLQSHYTCNATEGVLFPQEYLPATFIESIISCAKTFSEYQTNAIKSNIALFENFSKGKWKFLTKLRGYLAEEFIHRFNVQPLGQEYFVVPHMHLDGSQLSYWPESSNETYCNSGTHHTGSFEERVEISKLGWHERVVFPQHEHGSLTSKDDLVREILNSVASVVWLKGAEIVRSDVENWSVEVGKPIGVVQSSRFCSPTLISKLNEARENARILLTPEGKQLIKHLECLAEEKCHDFNQALNISDIVDVLHKCDLLSMKSRPRFIDITGNGRFVCEILKKGVCYIEECVALSCQNCGVEYNVECEIVLVPSCLRCDANEVETLGSFGRERTDPETHTKSLEKDFSTCNESCDQMKQNNQDDLLGCPSGDEKIGVKPIERSVDTLTSDKARLSDSRTCGKTIQSNTKPSRVILGSIFNECRPSENHDELSSRVFFLNQCVTALRLLRSEDCFVCELSDTLTQFTVGVLYGLHMVFEEISFITPVFCPSPKQFLICRGFLNSSESKILLSHMEEVSDVFTNKSSDMDVISIVPITKLFSEQFYKYIRTQSTSHATAQVNCIINCERLLLSKSA